MQLHISPDIPDEPELPVHMNPGHGTSGPFGIIHLGEDADLHVNSGEDEDRLIRAAGRIKAMRAKLGTPHEFTPGAGRWGSHCEVCGAMDNEDHWKPPQAAEGNGK